MILGATSVTTRRPRVTARAAAAAVAVVAVAAPVSGCSFWAPKTTIVSYAPGEGLNAELPDVWVRNLLVVGQAEDGAGVLSGAFFNQTDAAVEVTLSTAEGGLDTTISIPAEGRVLLTAPGREAEGAQVALVDPVGAAAGQTLAVSIVTPAYGEIVLEPPVTLPTSEYEGFLDQVPNAQGSGPPLEEIVELQNGEGSEGEAPEGEGEAPEDEAE